MASVTPNSPSQSYLHQSLISVEKNSLLQTDPHPNNTNKKVPSVSPKNSLEYLTSLTRFGLEFRSQVKFSSTKYIKIIKFCW